MQNCCVSTFKINIENGLLSISYEKKLENVSEEVKSVRKEFSFESFKRSFSIDEKIQADNIQAKYENGVLKLYLPKKDEVKETPKEISIQ
jgi:HSP20 family protein